MVLSHKLLGKKNTKVHYNTLDGRYMLFANRDNMIYTLEIDIARFRV